MKWEADPKQREVAEDRTEKTGMEGLLMMWNTSDIGHAGILRPQEVLKDSSITVRFGNKKAVRSDNRNIGRFNCAARSLRQFPQRAAYRHSRYKPPHERSRRSSDRICRFMAGPFPLRTIASSHKT